MDIRKTVRLNNDDMFTSIDDRLSEKHSTKIYLYVKRDILNLFNARENIVLEGEKLSCSWGYNDGEHRYIDCYACVEGTNEEVISMAKNRLKNARDIIEKELNARTPLPKTTIQLSDL